MNPLDQELRSNTTGEAEDAASHTDRVESVRRTKSGQLALELPVEPSVTRADLLESPANQLAVDLIDHWPDWPSQWVVLAGPVGAGKTHLAAIWAANADARVISAAQLAAKGDLAGQGNLVVEDVGAGGFDEESLFHAFNLSRNAGHYMLITSRSFPSGWSIGLPDLASRMKLAHLIELQEPDDALLSGIIVKLFADRQLEVSPPTVRYLVGRMERSLAVAGEIVAWLDREALARGKAINRALAAEAIEAFEGRGA